jgi:WD40 repeat protein
MLLLLLLYAVFALVTTSGSLIVYNMHVFYRALLKMTVHSGDTTTLDWHPTFPHILATGGAIDRCVKIWDLESYLTMTKDTSNVSSSYGSLTSRAESGNTESSADTDRSR